MTSSHDAPPESLDQPLELDPADWEARQIYFLMIGLVVPRPIAWVSTLSPSGVANLAPHSYFNVVAHDPPHVMFSSSGVKDTLRNLRQRPEFVVNLVSRELVEPMNFTATDFPPEESEFDWAQVETAPSARVAPPRVAAAKAHLECEVVTVVEAGNGNLVLGRVVHFHVDPSAWRAGRIDPTLLDPVARLGGALYTSLGEVFRIDRPKWGEVQGTAWGEAMPRAQRA